MLTREEIIRLDEKRKYSALTNEDIESLFDHILDLEGFLDDADMDDSFGTEGWRVHFGVE